MKNLFSTFFCVSIILLTLITNALAVGTASVKLSANVEMGAQNPPCNILLNANIEYEGVDNSPYLSVTNPNPSYTKLLIGYGTTSVYSPSQNVISSGNNALEIVLRANAGFADWSRVLIRPKASGTLSIAKYITAAGGNTQNWTTLIIPLADFGAIDFSSLNFIEFPYSQQAAQFKIDIKSMRFIGGTSPFTWFGDSKTDNAHNGNGGVSELVAKLIIPTTQPVDSIVNIKFYCNDSLLTTKFEAPFSYQYNVTNPFVYNLKAIGYTIGSDTIVSNTVSLEIKEKETITQSTLQVALQCADTLITSLPNVVRFNSVVSGISLPEPTYLKVENNTADYRKLKLGYNATNIYGPGVDVVASGNNRLEITMKLLSGNPDWNKVLIRPMAKGMLNLSKYIMAVGNSISDWKTISIPLSDFDPSIAFNSIAYIEFPYNSNAGNFVIAIEKVIFLGGTTPFVWFGNGKTDNIHDGRGGVGELTATLVPGVAGGESLSSVDLFCNDSLIATSQSTNSWFDWNATQNGVYNFMIKATDSKGLLALSNKKTIHVAASETPISTSELTVQFSSNYSDTIRELPTSITFDAIVGNIKQKSNTYLKVENKTFDYCKLKLGYGTFSVYNPSVNVINGGNNALEIKMKLLSGTPDWSKVLIRPVAKGMLNLSKYVNQTGGDMRNWQTITIPLSDFDATIDFSAIPYLEFPYSNNCGLFEIAIEKIAFVGGTTPLVWFGDGKTDNIHDGNGAAGALTATLMPGSNETLYPTKVELLKANLMVASDTLAPYTFTEIFDQEGVENYRARVIDSNSDTLYSNNIEIIVKTAPVIINNTPLTIELSGINSDTITTLPTLLQLQATVGGIIESGPDFLKVTNSWDDYRKLKFGYHPTTIYGVSYNVTEGGNNYVEVTMKLLSGTPDWSKVMLRPSEKGLLNLSSYIAASGSDMTNWTTLRIPLAHFDATINFAALSYIEFPFSQKAGNFEIAIQKVIFGGGETPFVWFGNGKIDNYHNGNGLSGALLATVVPAQNNELSVEKVDFYCNQRLIETDFNSPFVSNIRIDSVGLYRFWSKVTDSNGATSFSDTLATLAIETIPQGTIAIEVNFDSVPQYASAIKAKLKYDKDFAYSFTFDDGYSDALTNGFTLLNGGYMAENGTNYNGLVYTDGCGNDLKFNAAIALNSVNSQFMDIHQNTPSYLKWGDIEQLYNSGWDILNHSYSHAAYGSVNYAFQVTENRRYVKEKTGIDMTHFVIPSGDLNYVPYSFAVGNKANYSQNWSWMGQGGLNVSNALNYNNFNLTRDFVNDPDYTPANIMNKINSVASKSVGDSKYWYNEFTHNIRSSVVGGGLQFSTFAYYMQNIENQYGKGGSDRIWMAPLQEVYEYLRVRDNAVVSSVLKGNKLTIYLDTALIPKDLRRYALSFVVNCNLPITSVSSSDVEIVSYNANAPKKLINIAWDNSVDSTTTVQFKKSKLSKPISSSNETLEDFNLALNVSSNKREAIEAKIFSPEKQAVSLEITDIAGKRILHSIIYVDKGFNHTVLTSSKLAPGVYIVALRSKSTISTQKVVIK